MRINQDEAAKQLERFLANPAHAEKYVDIGFPVYTVLDSGAEIFNTIAPQIDVGQLTVALVCGYRTDVTKLQRSITARYHRVREIYQQQGEEIKSRISLNLVNTEYVNAFLLVMEKKPASAQAEVARML